MLLFAWLLVACMGSRKVVLIIAVSMGILDAQKRFNYLPKITKMASGTSGTAAGPGNRLPDTPAHPLGFAAGSCDPPAYISTLGHCSRIWKPKKGSTTI